MSPLRRRRTSGASNPSEMACEACNTKFSLFKRKKQCMDCLRYFCSECVIKRLDRVFACDSCSVLSRRPLVRNQIRQMRSRDLRQYLLAKKVSIKGCVEKEDLVHVLMLFANGTDPCLSSDYSTNVSSQSTTREPLSRVDTSFNRSEDMPNISRENEVTRDDIQEETNPTANPLASPSARPTINPTANPTGTEDIEIAEEITESDSNPIISVPFSTDDNESPSEDPMRNNNVEIEEVFECDSSAADAPEPIITEQDEVSEPLNEVRSDMVTEIPTWSDKVQLSDIKEASELEYLTIKQLKSLLSTNRVDYKGCLERQELLNRVSRLWQEYKQSREDVEGLSEEEICKICWDAPIECVILECGHMACCINCGKQMSECPICKQYVVRVVRFFKA